MTETTLGVNSSNIKNKIWRPGLEKSRDEGGERQKSNAVGYFCQAALHC